MNYVPVSLIPGDDVTEQVTGLRRQIKLGPGLIQTTTENGDERVVSQVAGVLRYRAPVTYYVESNRKRYFPRTDDQVVGIIEDRGGDFYKVNIFSGSSALLSRLAFEGASKRNRPELKRGDVIYARVSLAHRDLDVELTCISASGSKKEWTTGETVFPLFFIIPLLLF